MPFIFKFHCHISHTYPSNPIQLNPIINQLHDQFKSIQPRPSPLAIITPESPPPKPSNPQLVNLRLPILPLPVGVDLNVPVSTATFSHPREPPSKVPLYTIPISTSLPLPPPDTGMVTVAVRTWTMPNLTSSPPSFPNC